MNKRVLVIVAILCLVTLLGGACSQPAPAPSPAPTVTVTASPKPTTATPTPTATAKPTVTRTLRFQSTAVEANLPGVTFKKFAEGVSQRTNGKFKFEYFWSGSLVKGEESLGGVKDGLLDFAEYSLTYFPGELPFSTAIAMMPFGWYWDNVSKVMANAAPLMNDELQKFNNKYMWGLPVENGIFTINPMDPANPSLKGRKIRVFGGGFARLAELLGATGISMASGEVPVALATKTIDGYITSLESYNNRQDYKVAPYSVATRAMINSGVAIMMNNRVFTSLTPEEQKIFTEEALKVQDWAAQNGKTLNDNILTNLEKQTGVKVSYLTPEQALAWRKLSQPIYDELIKKYPDKGKKFVDFLDQINAARTVK